MTRFRSGLDGAEASAGGRAMISVVITAALAAIVIGSLPESALRRALVTHAGPALDAVGIQQRWDLFAPDPRRVSIDLGAHISYADGRVETWRLPRRGPLLGAYSDYRWRKLAERVIVGGGDEALAQDVARWLARRRSARRPRQVQLFARYARLAPPGSAVAVRPGYVQRTLVSLRLAGRSRATARR